MPFYTIEKQPVEVEGSGSDRELTVSGIEVLAKDGGQLTSEQAVLADPKNDCCIVISFSFDRHGKRVDDKIAVMGDEFFRVRKSLPQPRVTLTKDIVSFFLHSIKTHWRNV